MSEPNRHATVPSVDDIVHRPFRFSSLLDGVVVAYPEGSRLISVVVRMDGHDDKWDCYCSDVEFQSFTSDRRVCTFVCNERSFNCECRIVGPIDVPIELIEQAASDLWRNG